MYCSECGTEIKEGKKFCSECGAPVAARPAAAPAPVAPIEETPSETPPASYVNPATPPVASEPIPPAAPAPSPAPAPVAPLDDLDDGYGYVSTRRYDTSPSKPPSNPWKAALVTIVVVLVLAGAGVGAFMFGSSGGLGSKAPASETTETAPSPADTSAEDSGATEAAPPATAAKYKAGDHVYFGGYEWRVLEVAAGKMLLLSEYVLEHRAYSNEATGDPTWENSSLRSYLNGEFLNSFSASDRGWIVETHLVNSDNPWTWNDMSGEPGGNDTDDRIFVLSPEEVVRYFGDSGQFANQPKDVWVQAPDGEPYIDNQFAVDDQYNEARRAYCFDDCPYYMHEYQYEYYGMASNWWVRSPGASSSYNAFVGVDGAISLRGEWSHDDYFTVRPALWLDLAADLTADAPAPPSAPSDPTDFDGSDDLTDIFFAFLDIFNDERWFYQWQQYTYLSELLDELSEAFEATCKVANFTLVDMDGDGAPELVAHLNLPFILVFHYDDDSGEVYALMSGSERAMRGVKKDGTFDGADSWLSGSIMRLQFLSGGGCEVEELVSWGYADWNDEDSYRYLHNGKEITEAEWQALLDEQNNKAEPEWYPYKEANIEENYADAWNKAFP